ncbi:uncharacterized protein LOC126412897 [Schistocerca serialis cubense]|uniref:uncharacterized protein LOC126412897 n=1 Tax=Schistocerca serialis cubense TaxID=2023355 RepID=UPI00214EE54A|nr:uncharacterized protein LOC126412897 [Schistocerca serialis cubense]
MDTGLCPVRVPGIGEGGVAGVSSLEEAVVWRSSYVVVGGIGPLEVVSSAVTHAGLSQDTDTVEDLPLIQMSNVEADMTMRITKLFDLIKQHKPEDKVFEINKILEAHGHTVLRLPPYNCDLNPIEMAWAKLKNFVRRRNILGDICMTKLLQLVKEGFETITQDDWSAYCLHVEKLEREYCVKDGVMEDIIDAIVINLESDDDEDDDDDVGNDSDNVDDDLSNTMYVNRQ